MDQSEVLDLINEIIATNKRLVKITAEIAEDLKRIEARLQACEVRTTTFGSPLQPTWVPQPVYTLNPTQVVAQ